MGPAMTKATELRTDFGADELRVLALACSDLKQARRLQGLVVILDGGSNREAARAVGVTPQSVREWVNSSNAHGLDGLVPHKFLGKTPILNDNQRRALARVVEAGPRSGLHAPERWRLIDLAQWVWDQFGLRIGKGTLSKELRALGYRKQLRPPRRVGQTNDTSSASRKSSRAK